MGFQILKIKTGVNIEQDLERMLRLREMVGPAIQLRVDANQGYDLSNLKRFLAGAETADIELIEQLLPATADEDLLQLTDHQRAILVADESLLDASAAFNLAHTPKRYGVYNIKLMKCGGIRAAKEIALLAQQGSIELFWGCNDESRLSITAALHVALSCPNTRYLDLDGSLELSNDIITGGFRIENGCLVPLDGPGFGCQLT